LRVGERRSQGQASRADAAGQEGVARFALAYSLPGEFLAAAPPTAAAEPPLWLENWLQRIPAIVAVVAMLLALYLILVFQNQIAARPKLDSRAQIATRIPRGTP